MDPRSTPTRRAGARGLLAVAAAAAMLAAGGCSWLLPQDPSDPALTGDITVHDPGFVDGQGGEPSFVYSTGDGQIGDGNVQIRRSDDNVAWEYAGEVWPEKPAWLEEAVPGVDNLWAPELYEHDGTWYLYYSASTFGSNRSVIALATNSTLDPAAPGYEWVDRGAVVASSEEDDFNAIDPGIVEDADGTPWMSFGSFWSGIRMVELEWPSGERAGGDGADAEEPLRLADRQEPPNAIEAPYVVPHDGYYYLFFSRDFCCRGLESTYNMAVGRSADVTGPYVDRDGVPLLENGGTPVLTTDGGPASGGQSVSNGVLAYHYYDPELDGRQQLALETLRWVDGWPVAG